MLTSDAMSVIVSKISTFNDIMAFRCVNKEMKDIVDRHLIDDIKYIEKEGLKLVSLKDKCKININEKDQNGRSVKVNIKITDDKCHGIRSEQYYIDDRMIHERLHIYDNGNLLRFIEFERNTSFRLVTNNKYIDVKFNRSVNITNLSDINENNFHDIISTWCSINNARTTIFLIFDITEEEFELYSVSKYDIELYKENMN